MEGRQAGRREGGGSVTELLPPTVTSAVKTANCGEYIALAEVESNENGSLCAATVHVCVRKRDILCE